MGIAGARIAGRHSLSRRVRRNRPLVRSFRMGKSADTTAGRLVAENGKIKLSREALDTLAASRVQKD
jgi:hypothetical protein